MLRRRLIQVDNLFSKFDKNYSWLEKNTILLTKAGSHSYGTNRPDSDEDYRGIALGRSQDYFGLKDPFLQYSLRDPDAVVFEFKKAIKLLAQNNPNILEMLWIENDDIIHSNNVGKDLISKRDWFLSKQCKERYLGYSKAQMYRIESHRKWLLEPLKAPPVRKDYDLPDHLSIPTEQWEAVNAQMRSILGTWNPDWEPFSEAQKIWLDSKLANMLTEMQIVSEDTWQLAARKLGYSENFILLLNKEKQFEAAQKQWEAYSDWKKNRNPKRAGMEAKIGYDVKHANHCIRLLFQVLEIFEYNTIFVKRKDADYFKAILNGEFTFNQIKEKVNELELKIKLAYDKTTLQSTPKLDLIEDWVIFTLKNHLNGIV